jgi:hypothetical protein
MTCPDGLRLVVNHRKAKPSPPAGRAKDLARIAQSSIAQALRRSAG